MINLTSVDVYDEVPSIVTIWLTIMPKISILILLIYLIDIGTINSSNIYPCGINIEIFNNLNILSHHMGGKAPHIFGVNLIKNL